MDEEVQQQVPDEEVQERAFNYAFMLQNLMVVIQEYLFLSDDNKERGAQNATSSHLRRSLSQARRHLPLIR